MIKRNTAKQQKRGHWRTYTLIFVCGLLTVSGVFLTGRQHFSWMDYGMKNSKLRKQIEDLEGEKRRLLLAREISLSPMEIKKAAKKVGMADPSDATVVAQVSAVTKDKAVPATTTTTGALAVKSMIVKTVAVTPAPTAAVASYKKTERPARSNSKPAAAE